jgi:hypothetical protein
MERAEARRLVLRGKFAASQEDYKKWKLPSWKLLVFISSTFTDTLEERNCLTNDVKPIVTQLGSEHDIDVVFIDMRWGIRDQNTLDHKTWEECHREIMRSQNESAGLSFISLQSHK